MPIHMLEASGSRCPVNWFWRSWVRTDQIEREAILDYQELVGRELGRKRILQNLSWTQYLWSGLDGFDCCSC